jgi:indole-3-glycerol phosphate synthase
MNPQSAIHNPQSAGGRDLLAAIVAATRRIVEVRQSQEPIAALAERAAAAPSRRGRFGAALSRTDRVNIIAECKRRSPSRGVLRADYDQLLEAKAAGADAVLLIVSALRPVELKVLHDHAARMGLDVLVEVHDETELAIALDAGARIVGVNNRNLRTLAVDVRASDELMAKVPEDVVAVSESGLRTAGDLLRLRTLGYRAFLIGERFMIDKEPGRALRELIEGCMDTKDTRDTKVNT